MRRLLALTALFLACCSAVASNGGCDVNVESDYDLALNERSVILTRDSGQPTAIDAARHDGAPTPIDAARHNGAPRAIVMRQGRLFVDDAWVTLGAADSARIAAFEQATRATMPEAQAVGRAAADIAFTVLGEVAAGLSSDPAGSRAKLDRARVQLDARLARSVTATRFDGRDLGTGISQAVAAVLPSMIGDIVGGAISAAFSGDGRRLKRMENLDAQIEARVQPRARALEQRAEGLCRRMVALDAIDNALEYRHHGQPLDLLRVEHDRKGRHPGD